jgi:hypothetical protein
MKVSEEPSRTQRVIQRCRQHLPPYPLKLAALIWGRRFPTVALFFEPNPRKGKDQVMGSSTRP